MAADVEICYTGIIGLLPQPMRNRFVAVAQDGSRHHHHPHLTWVMFVRSQLKVLPTNWAPFKEDEQVVVFQVQGVDLSFDNVITSPALAVESGFYDHVLDLSEGCAPTHPKSAEFDSTHLYGRSAAVALRSRISRGRLEVNDFVDRAYKWRWDRPAGSPWQYLAQAVAHRFETAESRLKLEFEGASGSAVVELESAGGEPIWAMVGNTMDKDVLPTGGSSSSNDEHVMMYYDLAAVPFPPNFRVGLLKKATGKGGKLHPRRPGGSNCPPALWSS